MEGTSTLTFPSSQSPHLSIRLKPSSPLASLLSLRPSSPPLSPTLHSSLDELYNPPSHHVSLHQSAPRLSTTARRNPKCLVLALKAPTFFPTSIPTGPPILALTPPSWFPPQGLCTRCSHCLKHSCPRSPHGELLFSRSLLQCHILSEAFKPHPSQSLCHGILL